MDSSPSLAATSIRSASSSMTTTTVGSFFISASLSHRALKPARSLTPRSENILYRFIISYTAHCSAPAAFLGSVTTGISRWGMPLYGASSTILGSTMIKRTSSGVDLYSRLTIKELVQTDLPEPVVPAISTWGRRAMLPMMQLPPMSLPTAKATVLGLVVNSLDSITSRIRTAVTALLGTSMPTAEILPGMGAIRTPVAPSASAISSLRLVSLLSLTP